MTIPDETLRHIVAQIVQAASPDQVILFGSAATGSMTVDSDIDLLVIESQVSNTVRRGSGSERSLGMSPCRLT